MTDSSWPRPTPRSAPTLSAEPTAYHQFWGAPGIARWRPIVVTMLAAVVFFAVSVIVPSIVITLEVVTGGAAARS